MLLEVSRAGVRLTSDGMKLLPHAQSLCREYEKLQMDLIYISHLSIAEDIRILFATVRILFKQESTEGIDKGETVAGKSLFHQRELVTFVDAIETK